MLDMTGYGELASPALIAVGSALPVRHRTRDRADLPGGCAVEAAAALPVQAPARDAAACWWPLSDTSHVNKKRARQQRGRERL